jgi:hypothetical protein
VAAAPGRTAAGAAFDKVEDQTKPPELVLSPEQASRLLAVLAETGVQPPEPVAAGPAVGRRAVQDFAQERILDRLLVYERRIEHSLYRTMGEFRKQRLLREMEPLAGGGGMEVSSLKPEVPSENPRSQEEVGRGRPTYEEPPDGGTPNESCETNPIGAGSNVGGTPNVPDAQEPSCQTNPICAGSNDGQVPCGAEVRNVSCHGASGETNPICGGISLGKEKAHDCLMSGKL